jgi:hypothetical protein
MSLQKLALELDETARQSAAMLDGIAQALQLLTRRSTDPVVQQASQMIVVALQGQDRIEQRCHNLATAVRQFDAVPDNAPEDALGEIWAGLNLDELRVPALSGIAATQSHGDAELF